jgi:hypothetical protein
LVGARTKAKREIEDVEAGCATVLVEMTLGSVVSR